MKRFFEFVRFFKSDNHRCRFQHIITENEEYYQVTLLEIDQYNLAEVFYLERFRKLENALRAMELKGIIPESQEYVPDAQEQDYWTEACV